MEKNIRDLAQEINIEERKDHTPKIERINTDIDPAPVKPRKKKSSNLIYIIAIIFGLGLAALIFAFASQNNQTNNSNKNNDQNKTTDKQPSDGENITEQPGDTETVKLIGYIDEYNLWTINSDGTTPKKITTNGDGEKITYSNIILASEAHGFVAKCMETSCQILNIDLNSKAQKKVIDIPKAKLVYDLDVVEDVFAYHVLTIDDEEITQLHNTTTGETKTLKTWSKRLGRGASYDDQVIVKISPNKQSVIVVNTFLGEQDDYIYIFGADGNTKENIEEFSTFIGFNQNSEPLIKKGESIIKLSNTLQETKLINVFNGYNASLSQNSQTISYWEFNKGDQGPTAYIQKLNSTERTKVTEDMMDLKWLDSNTLIGNATAPAALDSFSPFDVKALAVIDIDGKNYKIIIDKAIIDYSFNM